METGTFFSPLLAGAGGGGFHSGLLGRRPEDVRVVGLRTAAALLPDSLPQGGNKSPGKMRRRRGVKAEHDGVGRQTSRA